VIPPRIDPELLKPEAAAAIERDHIRRRGFYEFVKRAWDTVNPGIEFIDGWHIKLICDHLEAVSRGDIRRLIINVPPGASKSTITSVLWPAWDWTLHPTRKWMAVSCEERLTGRDALACRRLVQSEWYRQRWGDIVRVDDSGQAQMTQEIWNLARGGRRYSTTVGGGAIGWHGDIQLIDDPIKPKDMMGDPDIARNALDRCWAWWTGTMASRRTGSRFARVIIMQRLHELDLVGRILEIDASAPPEDREWTLLMLPMRFEKERACVTKYGHDPRGEGGELLCPARWNLRTVKELEREFGSQVAAAQLQQRPAPAGGNVFQRKWFDMRWMRPDNPKWALLSGLDRDRYVPLPRFFSGEISVDCAFKDTAGADNTALIAGAGAGAKHYLLDCIADRMDLNSTERCIAALVARHPYCRAKLIEEAGNGAAVLQRLRKHLSGLIGVTPEGNKVSRANAVSPLCEAEDVILPDDSEAPWVADFLEELVTFPFARRDDRVDAFTQWLVYASVRSNATYLKAMANVAGGRVRVGYEEEG
jgi:predicted phage terminase large subunit-like protein